MYAYPNEMQTLQAASKLLAMIRGAGGDCADYFHCGYVLAGFALKQIVGEPYAAPAVADSLSMTVDTMLERVRDYCDPNARLASAAALPPGFWRTVWEIAKQIIDHWLKQPIA